VTGRPGAVTRAGWGALVATLLVFAAGLVDDLAPAGPRGLRNHLRALATGRASTGIVKLIVIVAAAVVSIALQPRGSGWTRVAGVILVSACANVWNGLDVRPGRAIKFGLVALLGLVRADLAVLPTLPGVAIGSAAALWFDLNERAMLGDGGANLLGFTIGLGLYVVLPARGVVLAAIVAVAINAIAETTTLSRVIGSVAPLRWFDGLGRLR
jgi:UDP-GlcNAc:undecaprenyl-phosphate GlcNAc-1-phosphate transferase